MLKIECFVRSIKFMRYIYLIELHGNLRDMIFEPFFFRKRRTGKSVPDLYKYNVAPEFLRRQICSAFEDGIGNYIDSAFLGNRSASNANFIWEEINRVCRKELESYDQGEYPINLANRFYNYVMNEKNIDQFLSAVEIGCLQLLMLNNPYEQPQGRGAKQTGKDSIDEINQRFEQHAVGYQFENDQIIRVDSKLAHAEIIKPALSILNDQIFSSANKSFMTAHGLYRDGTYSSCIVEANRAFESLLKAICDKERWPYENKNRLKDLVIAVKNRGLFANEFEKSMDSFVNMLNTCLPSVRNNSGAHGEGQAAEPVTSRTARYALNMAAANILFLGECYKEMKSR